MKMDRGTYIIVKEDMKFLPSEDQLIKFLKMKIDGRYSGFISEINLYKHEPWDLPALSVVKFSEEWFFFTENSRKYKTSDRSNRQTEKGYWHETSKEVPVVNTNDKSKVIGRKRFLVFYKGRASRKEKTNWVMQEYFVPEAELETNLVLCRIKQKSVGSSREDSNNGIVFDIEGTEMTATLTFPEGFKFQPSEERLVNHYLRKKLLFPEIDLCQYDPHELPALSLIESNKEWFFFNRGRGRRTKQGYWKKTGSGRKIKASDKSIIGELRHMTFHCSPKGQVTAWVIHEYSLLPDQGDIVLCRLRLKLKSIDDTATTSDDLDMEDVPELLDQPEVNLDSLFPPLEPQQECRPYVRQSPLSTELGNDPNTNVYYSDCSKWQCALGTDDSYLRHLKRISTNDHEKPVRHAMAKFQNQATAHTILEVHPQTEDSAELGDALHYNECSELQSPFVDNDSSLTEFLNTCIADQDYYSSEESALIPSKDSNLATKVIRKGM